MKARSAAPKLLIIDACVLIDFIKADSSVLQLISEHVGLVHVVGAILEEVKQIESEEELAEFGLVVVEPEMEDAYAAAGVPGPTSFQDRLCMLTAKRHGFACVTNDNNLRRLCKQEGIPLMWGLELLAELHKAGGVSSTEAQAIAELIRESNPKHITAEIIARFADIIRRQARSPVLE